MAVGQGFEPREGLPSTVFKTAAFDHSASPPKNLVVRPATAGEARRLYSYAIVTQGAAAPCVPMLQNCPEASASGAGRGAGPRGSLLARGATVPLFAAGGATKSLKSTGCVVTISTTPTGFGSTLGSL